MIPIVSFYTKDTPYEQEAQKMAESAHAVGMHNITLFPVINKKSWELNCHQKTDILLQACLMFSQPFLYVDADARFNAPFNLEIALTYDLGYHLFRSKELLSGTLWVNPTKRTRTVFQLWQKENKRSERIWDQKALQKVVLCNPELQIYHLPPEYTWIFDLSERVYGALSPVITHYQASRRYRRRVK